MKLKKQSLFVAEDGKNLVFTFCITSSLFLLWGFCNGMIDVMDKHFQEELHLTLSQSAWVQFAHYLGYFLMSLPAGWLAIRLGYKGGIISGLLLVACGGFWFIPATHIAAFWAFLLGVCLIASGLTFLETIANPYTTVLGPKEFAATRINLAQSCNGIGWFFGPIAGAMFFYSKDAAGHSTGSQTLWIPYAGVAIIVVALAIAFYFAPVPDIQTADEYYIDDNETGTAGERLFSRGLIYFLLLCNAAVLVGVLDMILWVILGTLSVGSSSMETALWTAGVVGIVIAAVALIPAARGVSHHSIWSHPHFSAATLAQFFYVAAQAGIFSFLINYMTSEVPALPQSWASGWLKTWFDVKDGVLHFSDRGASNLASFGFLCFLAGRVSGAAILKKSSAHVVLCVYSFVNVAMCLLIFLKLGWPSVICVFLSYFFMSIMFPTIFALGIHGLGVRAKRASGFIVMAIMGGAMLPKLMGSVADKYDMSRGFIVPLFCFVVVGVYALLWPRFSKSESLNPAEPAGARHLGSESSRKQPSQ
ncbi:MAG TPA: MFS transporter [Candidatus Baltobacteraceae bacterium]|jgi:FHS family L-fucose permease-like MFS transporter|nr:MFS transporter [Candidatus Baltobacteraceae bacterium]